MTIAGNILLSLLLLPSLIWPVLSDSNDQTIECASWREGWDIFDWSSNFEHECKTEDMKDLNGHPASEILYEIIKESTLDNNTFYKNDRHVTCLFADSSFVLSEFGFGPFTLPKMESAGC